MESNNFVEQDTNEQMDRSETDIVENDEHSNPQVMNFEQQIEFDNNQIMIYSQSSQSEDTPMQVSKFFDANNNQNAQHQKTSNFKIKLPFGVRCIIYSYLDLMTLINQQAKLSKKERDNITKSEIVDQPRCLRIYIKEGKMIQFPQLEYCVKLATTFELQIEKMQEQDIFIFQTIMHMINSQNKQLCITIGMSHQIKTECFKLAIIPIHYSMIVNLKLKLLDQFDEIIPELCQNFSFVSNLELNLNNFALNFDYLPQSQHVQNIKKLAIRKNKFLFHPLVTMVENLQVLQVTFKEFTYEDQDLRPLKKLKQLELYCISDSSKYFEFCNNQFKIKFFDPNKIELKIEMGKFNLDLHNVLRKFNWKAFPLKSIDISFNKLKFDSNHYLQKAGHQYFKNPKNTNTFEDDTEELIFELNKNKNMMNLQNLCEVYSQPNFTDNIEVANNPKNLLRYKTRKFSNNKILSYPIYFEFFTEKTPHYGDLGVIKMRAKKFKFIM